MATEKRTGGFGFIGNLIIAVILLIAGLAIGILTPVGWQVEKIYYQLRYLNTPVAPNFLAQPYGLRIQYVKNEGQIETYLVNTQTNQMLPVYDVEGTMQVGKTEYRADGLLKEAQKGGAKALDKIKNLLDLLGK